MLMQAKRLANDTPNAVTFHRPTDIFLRDYESDPGITKIIGAGQNQQVLVRYFDICAVKYTREIPARQQSQTAGISEIGHSVMRPYSESESSRQTLTTFSATTVQNLAAICSCHASTETVITFAFQNAGLKCSFHCLSPTYTDVREVADNPRGIKSRREILGDCWLSCKHFLGRGVNCTSYRSLDAGSGLNDCLEQTRAMATVSCW
jgi:hypothetical protein